MIGGLIPSEMSCRSASIFPLSRPQKSSLCAMVALAELRSPTVRRIGDVITLRASCSTVSGSVAEKSARVTRGPSHAATAASTCSTKPISKSLSASSSTRNSTKDRLHFRFSMRDLRRRGVATRTSTLSISLFCVAFVRRHVLWVVGLVDARSGVEWAREGSQRSEREDWTGWKREKKRTTAFRVSRRASRAEDRSVSGPRTRGLIRYGPERRHLYPTARATDRKKTQHVSEKNASGPTEPNRSGRSRAPRARTSASSSRGTAASISCATVARAPSWATTAAPSVRRRSRASSGRPGWATKTRASWGGVGVGLNGVRWS
eukprot:29024-Pelagococcus_subviridis.AAC.6